MEFSVDFLWFCKAQGSGTLDPTWWRSANPGISRACAQGGTGPRGGLSRAPPTWRLVWCGTSLYLYLVATHTNTARFTAVSPAQVAAVGYSKLQTLYKRHASASMHAEPAGQRCASLNRS